MAHFGEAHPLISDLLQKKHKNIIQNWKCGHEGEELSLRRALEAPEEEAMNNAQQSRRTFLNQMTAMGTAFAGTAMIPSLNSEHDVGHSVGPYALDSPSKLIIVHKMVDYHPHDG